MNAIKPATTAAAGLRPWQSKFGDTGCLGIVMAFLAITLLLPIQAKAQSDWPMFGQNIWNTASSPFEFAISQNNVGTLKPKWTFTTGGDVSARAAVVGG